MLFSCSFSIPFERMCALYSVADAMVITSVRDGMNLVAFEYCASQRNHDGILILSEFAGAAQSLGQHNTTREDDALRPIDLRSLCFRVVFQCCVVEALVLFS